MPSGLADASSLCGPVEAKIAVRGWSSSSIACPRAHPERPLLHGRSDINQTSRDRSTFRPARRPPVLSSRLQRAIENCCLHETGAKGSTKRSADQPFAGHSLTQGKSRVETFLLPNQSLDTASFRLLRVGPGVQNGAFPRRWNSPGHTIVSSTFHRPTRRLVILGEIFTKSSLISWICSAGTYRSVRACPSSVAVGQRSCGLVRQLEMRRSVLPSGDSRWRFEQ